MAPIFVKNGTPAGEQSKCASCAYAHILQGFRESEEIVYCAFVLEHLLQVPFKVRECSNYADKSRPSWQQMQDLAIEILPTSSAKPAGFRQKSDKEKEDVHEAIAVETVNR